MACPSRGRRQGRDGRLGHRGKFGAAAFAQWVDAELPSYARPCFVRLIKSAETTGTFKYRKIDLVTDGFDPDKVDGALYVRGGKNGYTKLTAVARAAILNGETRL